MKYVVMCIGSPDGGDDAVGPYIADKLNKEHNQDAFVIDCGTVPENYTSVVKDHDPETLIIIDAVEMGLKPGDLRFIPKEKIGVMHISTHGIPLSVLINYLEQYVKKIIFIGIQPKTMSGKMTKIVKKSGDELVEIIKNKHLDDIETIQ